MAATLDARDARPLTSREISKVLCAILTGVLEVHDEDAREIFDAVVRLLRTTVPGNTDIINAHVLAAKGWGASWAAAFAATVVGFRSWCEPEAIETALAWLAENMSLLYPVPIFKEN